jgi:DNA modification methylase
VLEFPVGELDLHPVALLEFLIKTYTRTGVVVLDTPMDTGSTAIAAADTRRRFNNRILPDA